MERGTWNKNKVFHLEHGTWNLEQKQSFPPGTWNVELGTKTKFSTWNMERGTWNKNEVFMAKVTKFEDLVVFQMARELAKKVYAVTKSEPWKHDTRFVQQIHAAVGSIMDNIAEGFERDGNKEFINFLYIAKGSCGEVRSQIMRASDVGFIDNETATELYNDSVALSKAISKFITSIKSSELKGKKTL